MISPEHHATQLDGIHARERVRFVQSHPASAALAAQAAPHFLFGLPMHWMRDWATPTPLYVASAQGATLTCVDGHTYADFCLGDTGAMYGHSPEPVARAIAAQARLGLTAMLPGSQTPDVGAQLSHVFGLPRWQLCLSASDANRFVLRWARALTGRPKVLVFDGCYHGTVDDALVDMRGDAVSGYTAHTRASLLGQVHDPWATTAVVPFNDLPALEAALARGDVACVLAEPALTNCGLVLPAPGFWPEAQALCRRHGSLLVMDETHTISTGWGGWCRTHHLVPDFLVVGKAVAGGLPTAVYGFTQDMADRMEAAKAQAPDGHSGIGTTLSANLLALAALQANLAEVMTPHHHAAMNLLAADLHHELEAVIRSRDLPWCVSALGARLELQYRGTPPGNALEARLAMDDRLERTLHLYLLNRGVLVTPFHNMLLVSPSTTHEQVRGLLDAVRAFVDEWQH